MLMQQSKGDACGEGREISVPLSHKACSCFTVSVPQKRALVLQSEFKLFVCLVFHRIFELQAILVTYMEPLPIFSMPQKY